MFRDVKMMLRVAGVLYKGSSYAKGAENNGLKKNKNKWLYPLLVICFLPMLASMVMMVVAAYPELEQNGREELIIKSYLIISTVFTLFMGFFYSISVLFFATDKDALAHMPLKPWQICGARFVNILLNEYIFEAFVFVPFLITYGIMSRAGVLFYLYGLITFAVLPVIPVALLSILVMLIMRFVPFFKSKDRVNVLSLILTFVFMFTVYFPAMSKLDSISEDSAGGIFELLAGNSDIARALGYIVPSLSFSQNAMLNTGSVMGLIWILLAVAVSLAGFGVFMLAARFMYERASGGIVEAAARHRRLSEKEFLTVTAKSSAVKALALREIRLVLRTPVYFMNCCLMTWVWPVFFCAGFFISGDAQAFEEITALLKVNIDSILPYVLAGVSFVTVFISSTSSPASTAVSREGAGVVFSKMIPVPYYDQLKAKLYASLIICGVPSSVVMGIFALVLGCGVLYSVIVMIIAAMAFVYTSTLGLLVDMGRPKLTWTDENAAVKQNVNSMLAFGLSIPLAAAVCGPVLLALINPWLGTAAITVMSGFAIWAMFALLKMRANRCYENIQM